MAMEATVERSREEGGEEMELRGRKVVAIGERDGVPGEAIAEIASAAGADVVLVQTECFV